VKIIFDKISNEMQHSFWYQGVGNIAIFTKGQNKLILIACGEIRVKLKNENFYRKNQNAIIRALKYGFSDKDLKELEFEDNNWFDFIYKKGDNSFMDISGDECFLYEEAIEKGKEIINDIQFWDKL